MRTRLPVLLIVLLLGTAGCGASAPEREASDAALADAAAAGSNEASDELERRGESLGALDDTLRALDRAGFDVGEPRDRSLERADRVTRLEDRAFERRFGETDVDRALDRLPLREPPLDVLQWVVTDVGEDLVSADRERRERVYAMPEGEREKLLEPKVSHEVHARVGRERWYGMSRRERARAVRAFYREAEAAFGAEGIDDLVLVVTPLNATTENLPPLAIGRAGSASLTLLGRKRQAPEL